MSAILFLVFLPFAFFWRESLGWVTLGDRDAVFWFFPAYRFVAEQFGSGSFPFWTPYLYSGSPLFAQWQAGVLDPLNLVYLFGATSRTLTLSLQLSFSVSLISTWLYARLMGYRRRAAIVSAIVYSLGGLAVGRVLYPGFLHIVALVPLVLFFTERLYLSGRWRDSIGGALVVCWQLLAAHPQPLVYSSLLACAYALYCAFLRRDDERAPGRHWRRIPSSLEYLVKFALIFIGGAGLAAIQLAPAVETAIGSVRQDWPYELFTLQSLHPVSLLTTLFPFLHGEGHTIYRMPFWGPYWSNNEGQIYFGAMALALAIGAAVYAFRRRSGIGRFWVAVALVGIVLSLGKYSGPVAWALYHFPLVSHFRSPNRHWIEVSLAVSMLAGMATDLLIRGELAGIAVRIRAAALSLAGICLLIGGFFLINKDTAERVMLALGAVNSTGSGFLEAAGPEFYIPVIIALAAVLLLFVVTRSALGGAASAALILFLVVDYAFFARFAPITNPDRLETLIGGAMPEDLAARQSETDPLRYHVLLEPSTGEFSPFWFYGHEMATGYDPVLNTRYKIFSGIDEAGRSFLETIVDPRDRTLDLLNVRYVFVPPGHFQNTEKGPEVSALDLSAGKTAKLLTDAGTADNLTMVTALANSTGVPDGREVARIEVRCGDGKQWSAVLRAGIETAEWAWDRQDVRRIVRHDRAPIAESLDVDGFKAHSYIARFELPAEISTCRGKRTVDIISSAPDDVTLGIKRIALEDSATGKKLSLFRSSSSVLTESTRWRELSVRSPAPPYADFRIFENTTALPRVWLVGSVNEAFEGDQLKQIRGELKSAGGRGFDPRTTALVEPVHEPKNRWYARYQRSPEGFTGSAKILERNPNSLRIETDSSRPSLLVAAEIAMPGWRATVDGMIVDWHQVNYMLRAVPLGEGKHTVEFRYRPRSVLWGAIISLVTALVLLGLYLFDRKRPDRDAQKI